MKTTIKFLSGVLILFYLTGCEKEKVESSTTDLPATVSFSNNIVPILNKNCVSCHDASGSSAMTPPVLAGVNIYTNLFASVDTVKPEESDLYLMITDKGDNPMPPASKLSDFDVSMILKWMKQGARNN